MLRLQRRLDTLVAFALIGLLVAAAATLSMHDPPPLLAGWPIVIDGDTLAFGTARARLAGIDAPELAQSCAGPRGPVACGQEARDALIRAITPALECRGSRHDRYGRILVTCRDGRGDLAERLVAEGHAVAYGCCIAAEEAARQARRGLWALRFERPEEWRRAHHPPAEPKP